MIRATITGDKEVIARFGKVRDKVRASLLRTVTTLSIELQAYVKARKLSGASDKARKAGVQAGAGKYSGQALGVVTGRLRRSITHEVTSSSEGVTGKVGTNVQYAAAHEYGFSGTVTVREHVRKARAGSHNVRAHARNVNLPERSFLRASLRENRGRIEAAMTRAVQSATE